LVHRHRSIHEGLARTSEVFETSEVCVPRREVPLCAGEHKGQTADDWRACNFWVLDGVTGVEEEWGRDGEDEGP
jgi:hypothetical protein